MSKKAGTSHNLKFYLDIINLKLSIWCEIYGWMTYMLRGNTEFPFDFPIFYYLKVVITFTEFIASPN